LSREKSKEINISQNLKKLRNYKNITLEQLSIELNQKYTATRNYEVSDYIPPIEIFQKLSNYFEFSIDYIIKSDLNTYLNNIKLFSLSSKIDKLNSSERYKIESTIETLLKSDNNLKSSFDNIEIELTSNIHSNIKLLREKKDISQRELSKILNKSSSVINQYEIGKNKPAPENLIQLSEFFNVSIHYLITGQKLFFNFINKAFENTVLKADKQLSLEHQKFLIELMENIINS